MPVERSTVPTIESSGMSCTPRSLSLRRPSAATTSSNGSMGDTSSGPERRREASNDRARRRRCLTKSLSAAVSGVLTAAIVRPSRTFRILPRARSGWTGWRKMGRFAAVGPRAPPGAGSSAQRAANERAEHRRIAVDQVVVPAHGDREVLVREVPELGMAPDEVPGMAPHLVPVHRVLRQSEAVAVEVVDQVEAGHLPQRCRLEDVTAEQLVGPAGDRQVAAGERAGGADDSREGAVREEAAVAGGVERMAETARVPIVVRERRARPPRPPPGRPPAPPAGRREPAAP